MNLPVNYDNKRFEPLQSFILDAQQNYGSSAASVIVIQNDRIVFESYHGTHHLKKGAPDVSVESQFNIYSTRKTYVCLAMIMAAVEQKIPLHTPVSKIIHELSASELGQVTMEDLATATGPKYFGEEKLEREGVQGLIVKALTGKSISEYLRDNILSPLEMKATQWASIPHHHLVGDYTYSDQFALIRLESTEGHERNLYSSTRDLAAWGYLHLNKGVVHNTRLIDDKVFGITEELKLSYPSKRILGWYHQENWYYATGAAGCHCVVLPQSNAVGVRMFNKYTEDYTDDQMKFNSLLLHCLSS